MPTTPDRLTEEQARLLMSQLLDGELSPKEAERLDSFLNAQPHALDWMEGLDLARQSKETAAPAQDRTRSILRIQKQIASENEATFSSLIPFPAIFRSMAAAATIAVAATVAWIGFNSSVPANAGANVVEFVTTDIPDASTFVYTDEESGWTVVWVESFDPIPEDHG